MKFDRLKQQFSRFKKDDDGAIMAYIIVTFMLMVLATGMAIDLMRHEIARADIQNALDRAVLAAASRSQEEDREAIFESYMDTRNFHEIDDVSIDYTKFEISNSLSQVSAQAHYDVPTWFMKLIGITELSAPAASQAMEGLGEVEIVLVLDRSGSMNDAASDGATRMSHLKSAAEIFVNKVLEDEDREASTTISVVPFSRSTGLQRVMANSYNINAGGQDVCFSFSTDDFGTQGVPTSTAFDRMNPNSSSSTCPNFNEPEVIMPFSNDKDAIIGFIDGLRPGGWTSQHIGMKWGLALLDPSFNDVMQDMTTSVQTSFSGGGGDIPQSTYWGTGTGQVRGLPIDEDGNLDVARANSLPRPFGYNGVQKIVVFMTDGANRYQNALKNTARINQSLEYQCDLLQGRQFDDDIWEDTYNDSENAIDDVPRLSVEVQDQDNNALPGVKVYTVAIFPPNIDMVELSAIPDEVLDRASDNTPGLETQCQVETDRRGRWQRNGDGTYSTYSCETVSRSYYWLSHSQSANDYRYIENQSNPVPDQEGEEDYDWELWQDKTADPDTFISDADNAVVRSRIEPFITEMHELMGDSSVEGCASEGLNLVAEDASEFEEIFSQIAADITRLKLTN